MKPSYCQAVLWSLQWCCSWKYGKQVSNEGSCSCWCCQGEGRWWFLYYGLCCFGVRASSCSPEACVSLYSLEEVPYLQAAWILRIIVQLFCSVVFAPALSKKTEVVQLHKSREGKPEHLSNTAIPVHSALFKIPCTYVTLCELVLWWEPASTDTKLSELGLGGWTTRILLRGDALLSCLLLEPDSSRRSACA